MTDREDRLRNQIHAELRRLGHGRVIRTQEIAGEGNPDGISGALILALGSRESGMQNILNPAGTDRGWLQVSDKYHRDWLESVPGCPSGSWSPAKGKTAASPGHAPRHADAARYAIRLLKDARAFAREHNVEPSLQVQFAITAYNAGAGGAIRGYREGDLDKYTTGGEYGENVLERKTAVVRWLNDHPNWKP